VVVILPNVPVQIPHVHVKVAPNHPLHQTRLKPVHAKEPNPNAHAAKTLAHVPAVPRPKQLVLVEQKLPVIVTVVKLIQRTKSKVQLAVAECDQLCIVLVPKLA